MLGHPAVVFPDGEAWAISYLKAALLARPVGETFADDVTVSNKVPATMPARMVTIRDDGGPRQAVTKTVSFGVNIWAASDADCSALSRLVVALFESSPGNGPVVAHNSTSGPYRVIEESLKPHRYASVDLRVRGGAL